MKQQKDYLPKQSFLKKAKSFFSPKNKKPYKEVIIDIEALETRIAFLVDGVLQRFEIEPRDIDRMVGSIYKGKIQNLEHKLQAAFVDIGQEKNLFLHYWDIIVKSLPSKGKKKPKKAKYDLEAIEQQFPIGADIVVQVIKEQIGSKGARTTTKLSLAGRFFVLTPYERKRVLSSKITNEKERKRLKGILEKLTLPEDAGIVVRTASEGKQQRYFVRDIHLLSQKWKLIKEKIEENKDSLIYQEPDLLERTIRDFLTEDVERILINDKQSYERVVELIKQISPNSVKKILHFDEMIPIFERFNIEKQIEQTFSKRVPLPSGGEIVIEETEALIAIDVNTGSHKGQQKDSQNYLLQVNLEAARESARQILLRNLGGLIIIDFIDMKSKKDRQHIFDEMQEKLSEDKTRRHIIPVNSLGIMQITRQRNFKSHTSGIYQNCYYCSGKGVTKTPRTMNAEIQRVLNAKLNQWRTQNGKEGTLQLSIASHPENLERLRGDCLAQLEAIERDYNCKLSLNPDPMFHIENFTITNAQDGSIL